MHHSNQRQIACIQLYRSGASVRHHISGENALRLRYQRNQRYQFSN